MINQFSFKVQTQVYYGIGYSRKLGDFLKEKGYENIAILVDGGVVNNSTYYNEIKQIVENSSRKLFIEVLRGTEEPDYNYLDEIAAKIRSLDKIDILIGIGGGSTLDITKAVAVLKTNPGKGIEYRGFDKVKRPGIPTLLIPTTAGTGSEATINAVFTDKKEMKKLGINGLYMNATYAVLDADWTLSCPISVAVSSGMDAMTHALESFMCNKANPLTRTFSKEAFRLLYFALPSLIDNPTDKEKRQQLLLGSYLAGIALFNSGSGIAGALSYPIGVHFKVPHGIGGGIFLASVVEFNVSKGYGEYTDLLDLVEPHPEFSIEKKAKRFYDLMHNLTNKLNVPKSLDQWGITRENVEDVAKLMIPLQPAFNQNPVPFSAEQDALEMLKKHVRTS